MEISSGGQVWRVGKGGQIRRSDGTRPQLNWVQVERILKNVHHRNTNFLNRKALPYLSETLNANYPNHLVRTNVTINAAHTPGSTARLFRNAAGEVYYVRLNGHAVRADSNLVPARLRLFPARYQQAKNIVAPQAQTNANLFNKFMNSVRSGNAINLKNNEKNRIYPRVLEQLLATQNLMKTKEKEAANALAAGNLGKAHLAQNRVGYLNNFRLGLLRGTYILKPLPKKAPIKISARSPNRPVPGKGKNTIFNEPLKKPHIVVSVAGLQPLHINPNTLSGFIKSFTGTEPENLKYWLRWARKEIPEKTLFRHMRKNVKAKNVRFSKA
jgi:hypothetical protein